MLLESRPPIILETSLLLNDIDEINLSFLLRKFRGKFAGVIYQRALLLKKELNMSTFSLKSVTFLFWGLKR